MSLKFVTGQCWLQVAPPGNAAAPDSRLRSVSLGGPTGNHVWAVDAGNRLHIRKEVSVVYPEGTSWLQVSNYVLLYVDFVQLPSRFCQIPICPGRIGQTVEHSNFKSTQPIPRSDGTPCRFHNLPRFADELRSQEIL